MIGILPVDKPEGPTSHDAVAIARRALGVRRIGHTGTLDPFATGLLLLCVGQATRLAEYLSGLPKEYHAVARLGVLTDTLDRTGQTVASDDAWANLTSDVVRGAFEGQVGRRLQLPPAFSAKKVAGKRAYDLARSGAEVELSPVEVEIHELQVLDVSGPDVRFRMRCSSGTYVRSVARDAGETLGTGAHLIELRRTGVGPFSVDRALALASLEDSDAVAAAMMPPLDALAHLPVVRVGADEAAAVRHGRAIPARDPEQVGTVALATDDRLLAVAEGDGRVLQPRKVLA
jgi:tRNA pseudouridine55 synthase